MKYFNKTRTLEDKQTQRDILNELKENNRILKEILTHIALDKKLKSK